MRKLRFMDKTFRNKADLYCLGVILAAALVFFVPVWCGGKTFYAFDTLHRYLPWQSGAATVNNSLISDPVNSPYPYSLYLSNVFFHDAIWQYHQLPWWNGLMLGGIPFSGLYTSPFKVVFYALLDPLTAHDLFLFLHLVAAGMFCFGYLRQLRLRCPAALLGGLLWMFNGYVMCWFEFESFLLLAATLPAALFFLERLWRRKKLFDWLGLTMAISWALGTGYAHLLMLQLLFLAFMVIYRLWRQSFRKSAIKKGVIIFIAVMVAFISCVNFFFLHYDQYNDSSRKPYDYGVLFENTGQVYPVFMATLFYPDFFGSPVRKSCFIPQKTHAQSYNNYSELCIYSGVITLLLTILSILGWRRYPLLRFYLAAGGIILLMCMGSWLYYPLYALVPGLKYTTPTRLLQLFGFCMVVSAAFGFDRLWRRGGRDVAKYVSVTLGVLLVGALLPLAAQTGAGMKWIFNCSVIPPRLHDFAVNFYGYGSPLFLYPLGYMAAGMLGVFLLLGRSKRRRYIGVAVLVIAGAGEMMGFGWRYNTVVDRNMAFPESPGVKWLREKAMQQPFRVVSLGPFYVNSLAIMGISEAGGYSTSISTRYSQYMHHEQFQGTNMVWGNRMVMVSTYGAPLHSLFNVKYFLMPPSEKKYLPELASPVYDGEIKIFENKHAFARAFWVPEWIGCDNPADAFAKLTAFPLEAFKKQVILEGYGSNPWRGGADGKVTIMRYTPNEVTMRVESDGRGFVVFGENWHPDWRATVDGAEVPVYRANYIMRAIEVNPGIHTVKMRFQPVKYIYAFYLSILTWLGLLGLFGYCCWKSTRTLHGVGQKRL